LQYVVFNEFVVENAIHEESTHKQEAKVLGDVLSDVWLQRVDVAVCQILACINERLKFSGQALGSQQLEELLVEDVFQFLHFVFIYLVESALFFLV
jgi:hypothetical protein